MRIRAGYFEAKGFLEVQHTSKKRRIERLSRSQDSWMRFRDFVGEDLMVNDRMRQPQVLKGVALDSARRRPNCVQRNK
jgi:hypothetical protein